MTLLVIHNKTNRHRKPFSNFSEVNNKFKKQHRINRSENSKSAAMTIIDDDPYSFIKSCTLASTLNLFKAR